MATYATTTSLQTRMIGTSFDSLTTSLATDMITDAENEVNKYLSKRYDVSVFLATTTAVPPLVRSLTLKLAQGNMYINMGRGGKDSLDRGNIYITPAVENLKLIQGYQADLFNTAGSVIADMSNASYRVLCNTSDYSATFNEDEDLNWEVDTDKLDAIDSERD